MIFFTSDQHFGHKNIIKHCDRPYSSVYEMDEDIIKRWNDVVGLGDLVYCLGDFTLGKDVNKYLDRLRGTVKFITVPFHHDRGWVGTKIYPAIEEIVKDDATIVMCHYPFAVWDKSHYGSWHLYGHVHNKEFVLPGFSMNVGVDHNLFTPVSLGEVEYRMIELGWYPGWKAEWIR
jgi:calcineurin-like phosphoesterase family protein